MQCVLDCDTGLEESIDECNKSRVQNVKFSLAQDFVYNALLAGRIGRLNILVCPACCTKPLGLNSMKTAINNITVVTSEVNESIG